MLRRWGGRSGLFCWLSEIDIEFLLIVGKICREDGEVDPDCFVDCQKLTLSFC